MGIYLGKEVVRFDNEHKKWITVKIRLAVLLALMPQQWDSYTHFTGLLSLKYCYHSGSPQGATKGIKVYSIAMLTAPSAQLSIWIG